MSDPALGSGARTVQPTVFLTHGGGPSYFMEVPPSHPFHAISKQSKNAQWLRDFSSLYNLKGASAPKAIVVVSAHWITSGKTVHVSHKAQHTKLNYDYGGFPAYTYELEYKPKGDLALSQRIVELLTSGGIKATLDSSWEFDHGVFVPLKVMWPEADVPVVEVSIDRSYDPAWHVKVGQALQALKHEGVLVIGSGSSTHNFQPVQGANKAFMAALTAAVEEPQPAPGSNESVIEARTRIAALEWTKLPHARLAHPEEDHFVPFFVAVGAAGDQKARVVGRVTPEGTWHMGSVLFDN